MEGEGERERDSIGYEMSQGIVIHEATEEADMHQCQAGKLVLLLVTG